MDEFYRGQLRLIVSANGFLGPANRRRVFPVMVGGALVATPTSDPISKTLYPNPNSSLRLADSPEPTPETISRRGILKFSPLAKLISGKPVLFDLSSFGLPSAPPPIENSEEASRITAGNHLWRVGARADLTREGRRKRRR